MNITDFLRQTNLEKSILIGYYGGGNYGDELLLEVLGNLLQRAGVQQVIITYQKPQDYPAMHRDFGYELVNIHNKAALIKATLRSKHILIGGGGLWGVDINTNTFLLSVYLFVCRWFLFKKVYLLGVGFYQSTTRAGRIAAWFAAKAANHIIARDRESVHNFEQLNNNVHADTDLAWYAKNLNPVPYKKDLQLLSAVLHINARTLLVAMRRPQSKRQQHEFARYNELVAQFIKSNPERPMVLVMLESESKDPGLYQKARTWQKSHKHLRILEAPYNPLAFFWFVGLYRKRLAVIAPQLHLIMTAHLQGVPFLPMAYDNKVRMLLDQIGLPVHLQLPLAAVQADTLQNFADNFFRGSK